ncbi:MAG: RNA 2',3'-cyclic phosphodiesterase [Thermoprotei archaeon]
MRVFVAVDLPDGEVKTNVLAVLNELQGNPNLKTVSPQNLHFTLAFIGEASEEVVKKAADSLSSVSYQSFEASLSGLGYFPSKERARIIWVGVSEERGRKQLMELAQIVRNALSSARVPYDQKPFVPHLTLARARSEQEVHVNVKGEVSGKFAVTSFTLKRSLLTSRGPIYSDLLRVKLL